MIRIHFAYRHVDKPWGGANNFIRALHSDLSASGDFTFTPDIRDDCDVLFMNELGAGPAQGSRRWSLADVRRLLKPANRGRRSLVVRAVNLSRHAFPAGPRNLTIGRWHDSRTIKLLNLADAVIFQSEYQRQVFLEAGCRNTQYSVIHNGADARFWRDPIEPPPLGDELRLVSVTTSPRQTKRHDIVAALSLVPGVVIEHVGAWPDGLPPGNVRRLGTLTSDNILEVYTRSHYLLHPAIKDPCPNSVFEGICAGLPVIYNAGPGSGTEIAGPCGLALDEHDPQGTILRARDALPALRAAVLANRPRYRIDRAAAAYREVFKRVGSR